MTGEIKRIDEGEDRPLTSKELEEEGTKLLRKKGFTWAGNPKEKVDVNQKEFERRRIKPNTPPKKENRN